MHPHHDYLFGVSRHLELVQRTINRMALCSMCMKLCSVILLISHLSITAIYLPVFAIWTLDGFYLRQERLYRKLYAVVCEGDVVVFSMDTGPFQSDADSVGRVMFSKTLLPFYGSILLALTFALYAQ